jgi:hypothetical protein
MEPLARYILTFVFLISAAFKIADFENTVLHFSDILELSYEQAKTGLAVLIMMELLIAAVIYKKWYISKILFFLINGVFVFFIIINITFITTGVENCGCWGASFASSPWSGLFKNIILAGLFAFIKIVKNEESYV